MARLRKSQKQKRSVDSPLPSDLEEDVDKFHRQRDKLSLDVDDTGADSDASLEDEALLDVATDEEEDDELDTDEEMARGTLLGRLASQAKSLKNRLRIADGEGIEDEEEEEEDGVARDALWGKSKRAYYDADLVDLEGSEEEEALEDEAEEAKRLQRQAAAALHADDYDLAGDRVQRNESSEEEDEAEAPGHFHSGEEARAAAVRQDALELSALVTELRSALGEVRGRLGPLLHEVRAGELATSEGISYLEAKHTLLVHYAACIVFYLLLKSEGRPVQDHPVIERLVEIRTYLEKLRPVDKRLHYQIEKLLAATQRSQGINNVSGKGEDEEAVKFGPRPERLLAPASENLEGEQPNKGETYRPPRLNPVSMELEENGPGGSAARKARRLDAAAARRAARSSLVKELAAEISGAPDEHHDSAPLGLETAAALRERQRMAARDAVEEELMVRVPLSRDERKRLKAQRREGLSGKAVLDDFVDDVADLIDGGRDGGTTTTMDPIFSRHLANQKFGADLSAQGMERQKNRSGDADLVIRESLPVRRAKRDAAMARNYVERATDDLDYNKEGPEEDEFYKQAKDAAEGRKRKREQSYMYERLAVPNPDATTSGARGINTAILKNRGLTPHRRKDMKNPRKKHRMKFAEANVRRKGQVQEVRLGGGAAYGGEGTGIKARVSKSVKF